MPDHGPFETEDEARTTPAVRAVYEAYREAKSSLSGTPIIAAACEAAGIELGAYDARILAWMRNWEPATCAVIAGLIARAWDASSPLAYCRHCEADIEPCPHSRGGMPVCKGWRHRGHGNQPIGSHYCGGRAVNPSAEPATGTGTTEGEPGGS